MTRFASMAVAGMLGMVLIVAGAAAPLALSAEQGQEVPQAVAQEQEIEALVAQLVPRDAPRDRAWRATARLQRLGPPAVTALVARLRHERDTGRNRDHGVHSTIQEALEKIGTPAIAELDRVLTPSVLSSTDPDDVDYVQRAMAVAGRVVVDADGAAALLVRVAREASNPRVRDLAFQFLNGGDGAGLGQFVYLPGAFDESWRETCAGRHWSACPFDALSPRLAAAVRPVLADVEELVRQESDARVRFAGAQVLARWGVGEIQRVGEAHLVALVAKPGPSYYTRQDDDYARGQSIEALGLLGVARARDVIAAQAGASSDDLRLTVARALARLQDPRYIPIVIDLMMSQPRLPYWSMEIARRSRNTAFVPALIDRVDDRSWNGVVTSSTVIDGKRVETLMPIGPDALEALRALTFQDFGADAGAWRAWWASNRNDEWRTHLIRFVERVIPQMATAEPWVMNGWMNRLRDATDPAVLPFVTAYLRHPRLLVGAIDSTSGGGWAGPHPSVALLMGLVGQGSSAARQLLYECMDATRPRLAILLMECTRSVASFDPRRAADRLAMLLQMPVPIDRVSLAFEIDKDNRMQAAELLLQLDDVRGLPALIEELESLDDAFRWRAPRAISFLRFYTQQDIPFDPNAPSEARRAAATAWRQWWQGVQSTFVLRMREARIDMQCSGLLVLRSGC
jgi:hypothetical protein